LRSRLYGNQERIMPIHPFLMGQAFEPEIILQMSVALERACADFGVSQRDDAINRMIAEKIIELAQRGLKDADTLHRGAVKAIRV
jgi:hypothetical protein